MSSIIDEINQAMPPGAVLDVTLETVQNLATALLRARAHILETQELYRDAVRYASSVNPSPIVMPELSTEYMELRDAIDRANNYTGFSNRIDDDKKAHYKRLLELQAKYFEGRTFRSSIRRVSGECND